MPGEKNPDGTDKVDPPAKDPPAGEEYKAMTPAQFAARIEAANEAGRKQLLKDLGIEKVEDAKARLAEDAKRRDAEKSELQRAQDRAKELEPKATRAELLEGALKRQLEAKEKSVPEAKKGLLELAPVATDPVARLDWLTNAEAKGLFKPDAPEKPANSRAGGPAPKPGGEAPKKHPRDMTPDERKAFQAEAEAKLRSDAQ